MTNKILYVGHSHIGDPMDVTFNLISAIYNSDLILSESPEKFKELAWYHNIVKDLNIVKFSDIEEISLDKKLYDLIQSYDSVLLMPDEGSPAITDPGGYLIHILKNSGWNIKVLPGPSSIICAQFLSTFNMNEFIYFGPVTYQNIDSLVERISYEKFKVTCTFKTGIHAKAILDKLKDFIDNEREISLIIDLTDKKQKIITRKYKEIFPVLHLFPDYGKWLVVFDGIK